ncbi:MAG: P-type conjugative transfer protein TrbL [bacterium]|nr:P-type conjugative transfer protein TrbL [bacterium]
MTSILTNLVLAFQAATAGWFAALFPIARNLFFTLATIEIVWAASLWVLERDDPTQIFVQFLKRIIAIGFFLAVLTFADVWIPAIIDGFATAGQIAGGLPELNPSTVIDQGIAVASSLISSISVAGWFTSPGGNFVAAIAALLAFLAFVVIAGQLALALIEMYVVIGGGVLLLGFAGSRWTMPFAERYLSYAVAIGIKLFVLYLIIGVGTALAASWGPTLAGVGTSPTDLFAILGASLVYMIVAWQIPSFASALIGGSVNMTLGTAIYTGGSMAAMAVGVTGIAARAAASGARGTTAILEAGRYARDARAAGSTGMVGSVAGGVSALATEAVGSRARRVAGIPAARTAVALRDRRIARFGDPTNQAAPARLPAPNSGTGTAGNSPSRDVAAPSSPRSGPDHKQN